MKQIVALLMILQQTLCYDDEYNYGQQQQRVIKTPENYDKDDDFYVDDVPINYQNENDNNQYQQMLQQKYYACTILSKYELSQDNRKLTDVIRGLPNKLDQQQLQRKIYALHVKECLMHIQMDQISQLFQELQSNQFEFSTYQQVFSMMDLEQFKDPNYVISFSQEDENILQFIDQFEKEVAQQRNDKVKTVNDEDETDTNPFNKKNQDDPKIFGYSIEGIPQYQKLIFLAVISISFIVVLVYGIQYIGVQLEGPQSKKKNLKKLKKL